MFFLKAMAAFNGALMLLAWWFDNTTQGLFYATQLNIFWTGILIVEAIRGSR